MLELRNPHSILAALQVRPRAVKSIRVPAQQAGEIWEKIVRAARPHGISMQAGGPADARNQRAGRDTERTGGGSAMVEPPSPVPLDQLWKVAPPASRRTVDGAAGPPAGDTPAHGIWIALDQVQDPQNVGAIFRLAGFFGVRGIVMTKDRSAPVNATVCDVATGGAEYVAFSVVANLAQAMEKARQNSVWVLGTCERSEASLYDVQRDRHWLLVMGNEGAGMRRLTRERCDQLMSLPAAGPVPSLNVAAATAACLAVLNSPA